MPTSLYHTYSLPNLTTLPLQSSTHAKGDLIERIRDARPVTFSISVGKRDNGRPTEKTNKINNMNQSYSLLRYTDSDISTGFDVFEREIHNFHQRHGGDKKKLINKILQRRNKKLMDVLSSCSISRRDDIYRFHNQNWLLPSVDLNLFSGMPCDHKIFCHLLLGHLHAGDIASLEDMESFYHKFYQNHLKQTALTSSKPQTGGPAN